MGVNRYMLITLILILVITNVFFCINCITYRDKYNTVYKNSLLEYYNVFSELNSIIETENYNRLTERNLNNIKWYLGQVKVINSVILLDSDLYMISSFILNKVSYILENYYETGNFTEEDNLIYEQIKEEIKITYETIKDEFLIKDKDGFRYKIDKDYDKEKIRKLYKLTKEGFNKLELKETVD